MNRYLVDVIITNTDVLKTRQSDLKFLLLNLQLLIQYLTSNFFKMFYFKEGEGKSKVLPVLN